MPAPGPLQVETEHLIAMTVPGPSPSGSIWCLFHNDRMDISEYFIGQVSLRFWTNLKLTKPFVTWTSVLVPFSCSLDSKFLVSSSTDGSARIWNIDEGSALTNLTRASDEKIEYCRFSRDGAKPFLFCTLVKGHDVLTMAVDISNWKRIGYKRFSTKPISTLAISSDGKYLALGNRDGDFCAVEVKRWRLRTGARRSILASQFPPLSSVLVKGNISLCCKKRQTDRVVISTSHQWGVEITKLDVPPEWKVWQIWLVLLSLFVSLVVLFYAFFTHARLNLRP
ncbi:SEC12-like protein 1 [Zea mays]|uniref:SEC12-like protein 1 n=1 Tax=Zea mays TaxID=4577 RepID=A0A3L6FXF1_MAIZE|nr:SEC12-like protein 1 [Zea mays]